jgi:hypothetical protein
VLRALQERLALLANKERLDLQAPQVNKERQALLEMQALLACKE